MPEAPKPNGQDMQERTVVLRDEGLRTLKGFIQLPIAVLKHPDLSPAAKITYGILLSYAWQEDFCWPAQDRLAQDMSCSVRQVRRHLQELKEARAIKIDQRGLNRPNIYALEALNSWMPDNLLKNKDGTDLSGPDGTDPSGPDGTDPSDLERTDLSAKVYSENYIQNVNVTPSDQIRQDDLVLRMLDVGGDPHSTGFYRRVARVLPEPIISRAIAETRDQAATGHIRRSPGACLTHALTRLGREHGYPL